jgi:hypothetical protein
VAARSPTAPCRGRPTQATSACRRPAGNEDGVKQVGKAHLFRCRACAIQYGTRHGGGSTYAEANFLPAIGSARHPAADLLDCRDKVIAATNRKVSAVIMPKTIGGLAASVLSFKWRSRQSRQRTREGPLRVSSPRLHMLPSSLGGRVRIVFLRFARSARHLLPPAR